MSNNIEISEIDNISLSTLSSVVSDELVDELIERTNHDLSTRGTPVIPTMGGDGPKINNIGIETSTDVTIGNQTYFQGTVIIKKLMTSSDPTKSSSTVITENGKKRNSVDEVESDGSQGTQKASARKKRLILILAAIGALLLIGVISLIVFLLGEYMHGLSLNKFVYGNHNPSYLFDCKKCNQIKLFWAVN